MAFRGDSRPGPPLHVRVVLRAPLEFAFRWCTAYDANDASLEGRRFERRVVSRSPSRVVFEDLEDDARGGWNWVRHEIALQPPDHWHSDSAGSHRTASLDYHLTPLAPDRTRLDLTWRRRPSAIEGPRSRAQIERATTAIWRNLAAALERDYHARRGRARRSSTDTVRRGS